MIGMRNVMQTAMQGAKPRFARCSECRVRAARLIWLLITVLLFGFLLPESFGQQAPAPTEPQIKAVYLYNFGKFVRWQVNAASAGNSFDICVVGKNPFGTVLDSTVAGESIDGKSITVRNIAGMQDAGLCKILFISSSEASRLKTILSACRHISALTVSDIPGFAARGGMIGFVSLEGRVRFEVNVSPMSDAGLTVSSELLKVATKVMGAGEVAK
jgi:hypothetical protein